jgi:hypothetical protein
MMAQTERTQQISQVNDTFTWLREPLLGRLPDGSLCCAFFTGGGSDGDLRNVVAAIHSDDDGVTWSQPEVLKQLPNQAVWAPSMMVHAGRAHIFWFSSSDRHRYRKVNHLLSTGSDGRTFTEDQTILPGWNGERGVDVRRGTVLRDGRVLLPIAWMDPVRDFDPDTWVDQGTNRRYGNFGWGGVAQNNQYCVGVMEANDAFTEFTRHGRVTKSMPGWEIPGVPFFENTIADLGDGKVAMLIRADLTNQLWRTDSPDGGRTWGEPRPTEIPNPGSKPRIINLPDGRIVLFHNPNQKDYDDVRAHSHKYRTPLEMWISDDGMDTWQQRETLVPAPALAQYPDGFYDHDAHCIYLVWENDRTISFRKITV